MTVSGVGGHGDVAARASVVPVTLLVVLLIARLRYTTPAHAALMVNLNPVFASLRSH
jgi:hypothetical protein